MNIRGALYRHDGVPFTGACPWVDGHLEDPIIRRVLVVRRRPDRLYGVRNRTASMAIGTYRVLCTLRDAVGDRVTVVVPVALCNPTHGDAVAAAQFYDRWAGAAVRVRGVPVMVAPIGSITDDYHQHDAVLTSYDIELVATEIAPPAVAPTRRRARVTA